MTQLLLHLAGLTPTVPHFFSPSNFCDKAEGLVPFFLCVLSGFYVTITFYHPQLYQVWTLRPLERCCVCRLCPSVLFFLIDCLPFSFSLPASFHPSLSSSVPPPAVAEDDKLPYTILCASAGLDKSCTVEGVWMGVGAGWGPQRNGFNLNYSS